MLAANVDALVNFIDDRRACDAGAVVPGTMLIVDCAPRTPRWIINFPTRHRSTRHGRLADIRAGIADLVVQIRRLEIGSIAVPALGADLCGVDWSELRPLIVAACGAMPEVRVLLFAVNATTAATATTATTATVSAPAPRRRRPDHGRASPA